MCTHSEHRANRNECDITEQRKKYSLSWQNETNIYVLLYFQWWGKTSKCTAYDLETPWKEIVCLISKENVITLHRMKTQKKNNIKYYNHVE